MDWMTLASNLTESLAWPIAIAVMFWLGKGNFQSLLERLISLKWGDKEAKFSPAKKGQEGKTLEETSRKFEPAEKEEDSSSQQIPHDQNRNFFPYPLEHMEEKYPALLVESGRITDVITQAKTQGEDTQVIEKTLISQLAMSNLRAWCEREYNTIFGSQIALLKKMNTEPTVGIARKEIEEHFSNVYHAHPDFYKGLEVDSYLKFLFQSGVIEIKNDAYRITKLGTSFLSWILETGLNENKYG